MSWREELGDLFAGKRKVALLGAGSVLCGDDAAGMLVASAVKEKAEERPGLLSLEGSTAPENFCGVLRAYQPELILLVDAAFMDVSVGEIHFLNPREIKSIPFSTHMLPLSVLVDYLQQETTASVAVIGIQPGNTDFDTEACTAVQDACRELSKEILSAFQG